MIKTANRFFSTRLSLLATTHVKPQPILAAKQFIPELATRSKIRSLRRKEIRLKRQIVRDVNNLKKHSLKNIQFQVDPVLGESNNSFIKRFRTYLEDPTNLAYGHEREEFEKLLYGAEKSTIEKFGAPNALSESVAAAEQRKKRALLTILNLKNSNSQDKKSLAVKFARTEFQREDGDTGSPEVQAAVMTVKIHLGMDHVKKLPKDKNHIQHVRELVQQRQKILKYLKRSDPERYFYTIAKLGLTDDVVTREFNMGRQYLQDYKVWGDKQLVKLSDKQQAKEQELIDLQKRIQNYNVLAKKNFELLQDNKHKPLD
ncbi:uncharacterized protein PRCAT00000220001 [Priceomyces carsonii]|uniref:uncharacterized protein n=1 Tax=Priceomyces carsonii TaxID=28549 RepID=UPI002ED9FE53|nr:unnamed protein product [Priceomyces carsonii]